ncbi:hypothetical protein GJAV_G00229790 [Gymnothorax javanicus]|nr:hypothetical protein GJAV_G00229790 [Gymnothorax javanicus]
MAGVLCCAILLFLLGQGSHGRKSEPETGGQDLFRGQDRYDFAIVLSALEQQCIWHFARQSGRFYLTYMIQWVTSMSNQRRLSVTVRSPHGFPMALPDDAFGHVNFKTQETGFYQMCFSNFYNRFGRMQVFIDFGVHYEGNEEAEKIKAEENKQLNESLSTIEDSINKLQGHIFHMWRHYNFARMRRGTDHYLLLSNYNYVNWWSATQSVVIIMAGYLQLRFLKKLFHTDNRKPRC